MEKRQTIALDDEPLRFEAVGETLELDQGPGKYRIGLIVLSNDYVTERDFTNMRPGDDVVIYTSRVPNTPECTVEKLRRMAPHITEAASLIVPEGRLDVIAYSCTSGTAVMGFDKIRSLIRAARPSVACTTPLTASLQALDRFDAHRIAVLTPYIDEVNAGITEYLQAHGKILAAFSSFKISDNEKMARLAPESIYRAALEADRDDADALFISCTAIRAVEVIERIEQKLGKPVVTAVQAMFWQSLRLAGYTEKVPGYGQLLRLS
jgi:maleate isomerase